MATGSQAYNLTYSYDQYGNGTCVMNGSTQGFCPQYSYNSANNHITNTGFNYDPAGDLLWDGGSNYEYDAEGRVKHSYSTGQWQYPMYNALGQRVERFLPNGSWTFDYLFGVGGEDLGVYSAGTAAWFDQDISMGGRILVDYGSPTRILHVNNLGTTTVTNDQTGAELQDELFYPWGQDWTRTGQPYVMHFAGMGFESPDQLYLTDFRKYNSALGRWMSPDLLSGDVSNPQSLNRYAYVLNNPVSNIDPTGLSCVHTDDGVTVDNGDGKGCSEMNNTPDQVNVSGKGPGPVDTSSLDHLASLSSIGGTSPGGGGGGGGSSSPTNNRKPGCQQQPNTVSTGQRVGLAVRGGAQVLGGLTLTAGGVGVFYAGLPTGVAPAAGLFLTGLGLNTALTGGNNLLEAAGNRSFRFPTVITYLFGPRLTAALGVAATIGTGPAPSSAANAVKVLNADTSFHKMAGCTQQGSP